MTSHFATEGGLLGYALAGVGSFIGLRCFQTIKQASREIRKLKAIKDNFGKAGRGPRLLPGMTICIEPMINMGTANIKQKPGDDWTVYTADGKPAAHYEHMIAITENGPVILTPRPLLDS